MKYLLYIILLLLLIGCVDTSSPSKENPNNQNMVQAYVTRVVDGDTIIVTLDSGIEERVRLLLIDTPETVHPTKPVEPFGPEASDFTKEVLSNKTVHLEFDLGQRDKYGRLLAYVWIEGKMLNEMLLENGLARVVVFQSNVKYVEDFRRLEQAAKEKGIGIWSIENYTKEDAVSHLHTETNISNANFIASKNSEVYHEINCPGGANQISASNAIYFETKEEAINSGRRMCRSNSCSLN